MAAPVIASTCAYGGGNASYVTSFLGVNYLIIAVGFAVLAMVYMASKLLPGEKWRGLSMATIKSEMTQLVISVLIIAILFASANIACNISTTMSRNLIPTVGLPSNLSPFGFADYYIGNLALNTGLGLLSNIYTLSITYSIDARLFTILSTYMSNELSLIPNGPLTINIESGYDAGMIYGTTADTYIAILAPLVILTIGMLFIQYIALPMIQYLAFVVVLPVAIILRSLSFTGANLRNTANAVLAIAIAAYLIYPLTISFDSFAVSWIFSTSNPEYGCTNCLSSAYQLQALPSSFFSGSNSITVASYQLPTNLAGSLVQSTLFSNLGSVYPPVMIAQSEQLISEIGQFMFIAVVLFAVNIAITAGFAMGLTRALNSGVEGATTFWSSL
jgi:hypothetical protein